MWFAHILTAAGRGALAGAGVTEVAARTAMAREVVDFFERGVPTMAATAVGLAGSAVMLFTYDLLVGLAA
jgi:hypothetical protein